MKFQEAMDLFQEMGKSEFIQGYMQAKEIPTAGAIARITYQPLRKDLKQKAVNFLREIVDGLEAEE